MLRRNRDGGPASIGRVHGAGAPFGLNFHASVVSSTRGTYAMPSATYFTQATDLKFSFMLLGWSTGTGEASSSLKALLMTFNKDKGFGGTNRGRYSNAKVDAFTEDALQTVDDVKRAAYLQRATEIVINDTRIIPLHFQVNTWATRNGITYVPRVDETTLAWKFKPKGGGGAG
jgi:peptide/nickel transport system substrate-binding protein